MEEHQHVAISLGGARIHLARSPAFAACHTSTRPKRDGDASQYCMRLGHARWPPSAGQADITLPALLLSLLLLLLLPPRLLLLLLLLQFAMAV